MAIGAFRNRPCYCGSGKKLKHCHLVILSKAKEQGDIQTIQSESPEAYFDPMRRIGLSDAKVSLDT
jgi:uncharacterized protein YecA (UPF0149 family)